MPSEQQPPRRKPRQEKRQRRQQLQERQSPRPLFPEPEPAVRWKPMG